MNCDKRTTNLPDDHQVRMKRALLSLEGLSVGDGFGQSFFTKPVVIKRHLDVEEPPPAPWLVTDDTIMALSIVRCLDRFGYVEQEALAESFAREYNRDPHRGYGGTADGILRGINNGKSWKQAAGEVYDGQGSCGNGGAMRAAPIGAYFAGEEWQKIASEAKASAEVTHAHPDGQTGAIAIALAAAWNFREPVDSEPNHDLIEFVLEQIPETETFYYLKKALEVPFDVSPPMAALLLGNGSGVVASDTVPFCLWCAARHRGDYKAAMWATVSGLGDRDTTCAIVGGIVALSAPSGGVPAEWLDRREAIQPLINNID